MKTKLLTTSLFLITTGIYAQIMEPTRFNLDSLHNPTTKTDYKYIRVVENFKNDPNLFLFTDYYKSGKVSMKAISTKKDKPYYNGPKIDYYENGNKKQETNYTNNKMEGKQADWYENGNKQSEKLISWNTVTKDYEALILQFWKQDGEQTVIDGNGTYDYADNKIIEKRPLKNGKKEGVWEGKDLKEKYTYSEIYNVGTFISGISADEHNNKFPYKELSEKPTPVNGMPSFYSFIGKNYKCPKVQDLKGKIYVSFWIDKDGSLTNTRVLRDIGYGTGQEAIRVLQKAEKWIPGKMRGIPTKVMYSLPIAIQTPEGNYQMQPSQPGTDIMKNTNPNW